MITIVSVFSAMSRDLSICRFWLDITWSSVFLLGTIQVVVRICAFSRKWVESFGGIVVTSLDLPRTLACDGFCSFRLVGRVASPVELRIYFLWVDGFGSEWIFVLGFAH